MPKFRNPSDLSDRQFWNSLRHNKDNFIFYYHTLTELAISMFEWTGMPKSIDTRFLELCLFTDGMSVFFEDNDLKTDENPDGNYLALRTMIGGRLDLYQIPTDRKGYSTNGYHKNLTNKDSVIIFNNNLHTNSMLVVQMFAERLAKLDSIVDINANAQKTPVLIKCGEKERLTMRNLYNQYDGNQPFIFGASDLGDKNFGVLKTDAPYVADKIYSLKTQIWNEALTYLGISNMNFNKKSRLLTDEIINSQGGTIANRYSRLNSRRQACEKINDMFGLNIWCNYREDYREVDDEFMIPGETSDGKISTLVADLRTNALDVEQNMRRVNHE